MQTNRYALGKIYAIKSYSTEQVYIGSTCSDKLSSRMAQHRAAFKHFLKHGLKPTSSRHILQYSDAYIELIENFPCATKDELFKQEGHHIRNSNCVNKRIAGQTSAEYYKANAKSINFKNRQYRIDNAESFNLYQARYRIENVEAIRLRKNKKIMCSYCNNTFNDSGKAKHIRTAKHIANYKQAYLECFGEIHTGVLDSEDY